MIQKMVQAARAQGWTVSVTGSNHWSFCPLDKTMPIVIVAGTSGSKNSFKKALTQLKHSGLVWEGKS